MFKTEAKIDNQTAKLELTDAEVKAAISVCEGNGTTEVIVMKKHNGGACFYTESHHANAAQSRHNFEFAWTIELKDLKAYAKPTKPEKTESKKD